MRNITTAFTALATATALVLSPLPSAHASSELSLSSSQQPAPTWPQEPEEPVDDRPIDVRLVEAAEAGFTAAGYTVDPQLTLIAQKRADHFRIPFDDIRELMGAAGYSGGFFVSTTSGSWSTWESEIKKWEEGSQSLVNFQDTHVGIALSEANPLSGSRTYVIVNATPGGPGDDRKLRDGQPTES